MRVLDVGPGDLPIAAAHLVGGDGEVIGSTTQRMRSASPADVRFAPVSATCASSTAT